MNKASCFILLLAAMLCAGCTSQVSDVVPQSASASISESSQNSTFEASFSVSEAAAENIALLRQADLITEQLVAKSFNPSALEEEAEAPTVLAINSFILTVPMVEDDDYMYKDFMRRTKDGYYEYPADKVEQIAYEMFGKNNWILEGGDTAFDETKNAYVTGLEFGIGAFLFCEDVSSEFSPEGTSVISKCHIVSDMAFDEENPGDPITKDYGEYQIIYEIISENNRSFLRFVAMKKA